jgi:hypothetical protein
MDAALELVYGEVNGEEPLANDEPRVAEWWPLA